MCEDWPVRRQALPFATRRPVYIVPASHWPGVAAIFCSFGSNHPISPMTGPEILQANVTDPHSDNPKPGRKPPIDAFLGTADHWALIKSLDSDVLQPAIRRHKQKVGALRTVHIHYVVPDFHFQRRLDILNLLSKGPIRYYLQAIRTPYFKKFRSLRQGFGRIRNYRKLFNSIRRNGLRSDRDDPLSVPWLFASKESIYRLDGHHRASIARLLGYDTLEVLLFTPKDFQALGSLPASLREAVAGLHEPEVDLSRDPHSVGREAVTPQ